MGHQHLQSLPRTRHWLAVVSLIAGGGDVDAIAAATAVAAEKSMIDASADDAVRQSFYLLTQIPQAARRDDLESGLKRIGIVVPANPSLLEIGASLMDAIDGYVARRKARTDYGELAQLAAVESLQAIAGREIPDLFAADAARTHAALRRLSEPRQFAVLARDFFARLTRRHLNFYLSRELASHLGKGRRFGSLSDHEAFEDALDMHCREASRIIKEFARDWYYRHISQEDLDRDMAGRFVHVAAGKLRDELRERQQSYA